jgi:hypothetical protein
LIKFNSHKSLLSLLLFITNKLYTIMNKRDQIFAVAISTATNISIAGGKNPQAWRQQDPTNPIDTTTKSNS